MSSTLYGLMAEFNSADDLLAAAQRAYAEGYREMDGYSHIPVHGLDEALGIKPTKLPLLVLIAGACGGTAGFFMQYIANVLHYPLNIGGRPYNSWVSFIPITFESTILAAATTTVFGMLALNGFPQPYHPVFNVKQFEKASSTGFFLCIESRDLKFDELATRAFLLTLGSANVYEVQP